MPFDQFFSSSYKSKRKRVVALMAAKHRTTWPAGARYVRQVHLEMRGGERPEWWHFLSVPEEQVETELALWRGGNPEFEFRVKEPVSS